MGLASFSLLEAGALSALLSLAIPLIIHLFNRSKGKIVWIGHVELVKQAKKIRVTEIKITQWILLILRLIIFTLLVLWLAGLVYKTEETPKKKINLVSPAWVSAATEDDFELLSKNAEVTSYWLAPGFQPLNSQWTEAKDFAQKYLDSYKANYSVQALLNQWETKPVLAETIAVYLSNKANQFSYQSTRLQNQYQFHLAEDSAVKRENIEAISIAVIFDQSRQIDMQLLRNAFNYLNTENLANLKVDYPTFETTTKELAEQSEYDWIIFLADQPVPDWLQDFQDNGGNLLLDSLNRQSDTGLKLVKTRFELIRVSQWVTFETSQHSSVIWQDKIGTPLLVEMGEGRLQFLSRFHPQWNDWAAQKTFPMALQDLLIENLSQVDLLASSVLNSDTLPISTQEAVSEFNSAQQSNFNQWLLLLSCVLLLIERLLAEKNGSTFNPNSSGKRERKEEVEGVTHG